MVSVIKSVNERVVYLLQLIAEHEYMSFEEMYLLFGTYSTASRYLNFLKNMGMIQEFVTKLKPSKAYCLSKSGWQVLAQTGKLRVDEKFNLSDYNYVKFPHNIACLRVRILFEKHPLVVDFKSSKVVLYELKQKVVEKEKVFRKQWKQFDAEMFVKGKKEYKVGVEVELTQKSSEAYAKKFLSIEATRNDIDFVAWLCSDQTILDKLIEIARGLEMKVASYKHRFCLLNEFFEKRFETLWYTVQGDRELLLPWPVPLSSQGSTKQEKEQQGDRVNGTTH